MAWVVWNLKDIWNVILKLKGRIRIGGQKTLVKGKKMEKYEIYLIEIVKLIYSDKKTYQKVVNSNIRPWTTDQEPLDILTVGGKKKRVETGDSWTARRGRQVIPGQLDYVLLPPWSMALKECEIVPKLWRKTSKQCFLQEMLRERTDTDVTLGKILCCF